MAANSPPSPQTPTNPKASAKAAGLRYVSDDDPGYTRKPWGRGFTYLDTEGNHIKDDETRERLESLAIPPAWEDVWICPTPDGHILATGRDDAGRKQYIYHPDWEAYRQQQKFDALIPFADALSTIRARCKSDLELDDLPKRKVLALVVRLLDLTLIRIGHPEYANSNDTFGLASMRDRHVNFNDKTCTFAFTGKSGLEHEIPLDDEPLVQLTRHCRDVKGEPLFQYVNDDGEHHPIDAATINGYLQEITGKPFTAKQFRTWGGTVNAAQVLCAFEQPADEKEAKSHVVDTVKQVAERLGNTPAICREYYIHPALLQSYTEGAFHDAWPACNDANPPEHLSPDEGAVLRFLKQHAKS